MAPAFQFVAEALELGLDDDAIVWYEPLYDPAGERPHFVALLPRRGVVVLEVLEAEGDEVLGALRGQLRLRRDGLEVELENPLARARAFGEILCRRLAEDARLRALGLPVAACAVLPGLRQAQASERGLEGLVPLQASLFSDDLKAAVAGDGNARILRPLARALAHAGGGLPETEAPVGTMDDDCVRRLRRAIQPDIALPRAVQPRAKGGSEQLCLFRQPPEDEDVVRVMDLQQENLARSLGTGHRVLKGVAGSGKTLILVYRARLLSRCNPRHRILFTCYTRSLASYLRRVLAEHENVEVTNLDRVMKRVIDQAGLRHPGFDGEASGDDVARLARQALQQGAGPRYHAVLLDEGQDFGLEALRFVVNLLAPGHDDLVVAMDGAQNIFRKRFSLREAGIQALGRTRVLKKNYRNTGEIGAFAFRFLSAASTASAAFPPQRPRAGARGDEEEALVAPDLQGRKGLAPRVVLAESLDQEVSATVEQVRAWMAHGAGPRDVAVLYASPRAGRENRALALRKALAEAGIAVFWVSDPEQKRARDLVGQVAEPVLLSTVHSAKGLEFPRVVLCGVYNPRQGPEESRRLAYVGMTRATTDLLVVANRSEPLASLLTEPGVCEPGASDPGLQT